MTFARRVFLIAAIYGFIVLLPQYFLEEKTGRDFPPAITHPEYFYGFIGIAVAWQIVFLLIAGRRNSRFDSRRALRCGLKAHMRLNVAAVVAVVANAIAGDV